VTAIKGASGTEYYQPHLNNFKA